jgi:hypothetical protein
MPRTLATNRMQVQNFNSSLQFFGGSINYITGSNTIAGLSAGFSIACWVKIAQPQANQQNLVVNNVSATSDIAILTLNNDHLCGGYYNGVSYAGARSSAPIVGGAWYHAIYTFNGTTGVLYINGVVDATGTTNPQTSTSSSGLCVGNNPAHTQGTVGSMLGIGIWNRPLLAAEAQALYAQGVVPQSGLEVFYACNEGFGTVANDTSGNGNQGTITGASFRPDVPSKYRPTLRNFGTCLRFLNSTDVVTWTNSVPANTQSVTMAAWIEPAANTTSTATAMSFLVYDYWRMGYRLTDTSGGIQQLYVRFDESAAHQAIMAPGFPLGENSRHHVVGVYTYTGGANSTLDLYVDGQHVAQSLNTALPTTQYNNTGGYVGNYLDNVFNGFMDNVRVYHYAFTYQDALNLYLNGNDPAGITPIVKYNFDEGSGTTAIDSSGNGNNGVISGATYKTNPVMQQRSLVGSRAIAV